MVAASVGAPRDPKMDIKDLIEMINKNTAAQEEQTRKMERQRQELGLAPWIIQEREPTELELLLQKWELPSREPEGVELPSREPDGVELPLPEQLTVQVGQTLPREVPGPIIVDTWPECPDLPALDLAPRSQHCQAQSLAWSLSPLPLESQTSLRKRQTSLRKGQRSFAFPLLIAPLPLPSATLHLGFQRSLCRSTGTCLCLSVLAPGHQSALWSPWPSHLGPSSPVLGPSLETPEGPTHPRACPWKRVKIDICGLEGGFSPVGQRFSHAPSLRLQTMLNGNSFKTGS
ncbi:UNVERIFIED_CONTAM: hypothetical protein FKN15_005813 [Acipenser sinensis]